MQCKDITIELIHEKFQKFIWELKNKSHEGDELHNIELLIFNELLQLGSLILQSYTSGLFKEEKPKNKERKKMGLQNCGLQKRLIITIFGIIELCRYKYYDTVSRKVVYPFDIEHKIPENKFSYTLQNWVGKCSTENTFQESVSSVNKIFNLNLAGMQALRISEKLSSKVDDFYDRKDYSKQIEGEYFATCFDDKGVSIRAGDLGRETESNGVRLGKGQKRDTKRHSTVSVSYSFNKRCRTADEVIKSLFKEKKQAVQQQEVEPLEKQTTAQHKHIRAFMNNKEKAIEYGFKQILARNGGNTKAIVVLIDGDRGLEHAIDRVAERMHLTARIDAKILDIIHVIEYVWKAANVHLGEKSPLRETWVKQQSKLLLESQTSVVIKTIEDILVQHKGNKGKERDLENVLKYFNNHLHMMNYATYLKKGYPISTGAVESACGHFVQNRMERNGMHWTANGAQNMLDLRAINKNKDWDDFMNFSINAEYKNVA